MVALFYWTYSMLFSEATEFVGDDYYYIVDNQDRLDSLTRIWLDPMEADYFPVTVSALASVALIWGLQPAAFHMLSLAVFLLAGFLSLLLADRLSGAAVNDRRLWPTSAAVACTLLMMLHPVNIESVSAIANMRELLYVLLALLALWLHADDRTRGWQRRCLILIVILAAQLSKGTAVVLPLILFLYSWLFRDEGRRPLVALRETSVYFVAGAILFAFQFGIALESGVVDSYSELSLAQRVGGFVTTLHLAVSHFVWPFDLSYEYDVSWPAGLGAPKHWLLPLLVLLGMSILAVRKNFRALFLCALVSVPFLPYSNLVPLKHGVSGNLVFYDHYLLLSVLCVPPLLVRSLAALKGRWHSLALIVMAVASILLAVHAHEVSKTWLTEESLYAHIVETSPKLQRGYLFLGRSHLKDDRFEQAAHWLQKGIEVGHPQPDPAFYQALGDAYAFSGRFDQAERNYRIHLQHSPNDVKTLQNLSSTLIMLQRYDQARLIIQQWLAVSPDDPAALMNLTLLKDE